ncbi:helix-turn-helix domain-containing protein, partial [Gulosibacter molinativorax]
MATRGPSLPELKLSETERDQLERWVRRRKSAQDLALRSRIVLECATGASNSEVANRMAVSLPTVRKWRSRFLERRLDGLVDDPRPGRPALISVDRVEQVV